MKSATPRGVGFAPVVDFTPEGTTYLASSAVGLDNNRVRLYGYSKPADALLPFPFTCGLNRKRAKGAGKTGSSQGGATLRDGMSRAWWLFDGGRRTGLT